jgi:hypothetical protein
MNNTSACETDSNADAVDFPPESGSSSKPTMEAKVIRHPWTGHPISGADRAATGGAKRPRPREPPLKDEESIDVDVVYASAGPTTITTPPPITASESADISKERANTPPPPKKRKLPTIKKNKVPTGPTGTMAPVPPSTSGPSKAPAAGVGVGVGKAVGGVDEGAKLPANVASTRKPAATVGSADFDLRKPSVYAELFKTVNPVSPSSLFCSTLTWWTDRRKYTSFRVKQTRERRREAKRTQQAERGGKI